MKKFSQNICYIIMFHFYLSGISVAQSNTDLVKTITINNLGAIGTQAKRFEIAKIGYNSYHWQEGGLIEIELRQKSFGTNYEKYVIELGYGQGTGSTSPRLRSMESSGSYRNAQVTLGIPVAMGTSHANEPNMILPIYVDVKYYTNYIAQIKYIRNRVETLNSANQIYINENPTGINIPDFTVDKGAEALYISKEGNLGLWNQSPTRKLHIGTILPGQSSDQEADIVSSSGLIIGNGKMLSFDQNYHTHASIKYSTSIANESRMIFQGYYGHAFTTRGDIPRMVINGETGNVGIGNSNPNSLMHLTGTHLNSKVRLTLPSTLNGAGTGEINLQTWVSEPGTTWEGGGIGMNVDNLIQFPRINNALGQSYIRFIPNGGAMNFVTTNNSGLVFPTMFLSNGNVGIGSEALPTRTLSVITSKNDVNFESSMYRTTGDNYAIRGLALGVGANLNQGGFFSASGATNNYGLRIYNVIESPNNYAIYSDSPAKSYFQGNVGIGTTTPKAKLDVNGTVAIGFESALAFPTNFKLAVDGNIIAEKVKVKNSNAWPDYVFKKEYQLPSLSDIEKYVNENSHLPEIPSAAEVEKGGQDLGEMNRLLLKKVEELTLYLIEQEKRIISLEKQNRK